MGSYTFKWSHPADEVYVTGTFDDWGKTVKLDREGDLFSKTVDLPNADEKIYYKFVVDGNWTTDHTAPQETDQSFNTNNILVPENIQKHQAKMSSHDTPLPSVGAHTISSAAAGSSTAELAGQVPKESEKQERSQSSGSDIPGAFPETPANELDKFIPKDHTEEGNYSVKPIPATEGFGNPVKTQPGQTLPDPSSFTSNTVESTVKDDEELKAQDQAKNQEQTFSVNPLPATAGLGNPVKVAPGEKLPEPSSFTNNTIDSNVTYDKESYERGAPQLPQFGDDTVTPAEERAKRGGMFSIPGLTDSMIPESSLPMGNGKPKEEEDAGPFVQSAAPQSSTSQMAGQVPLEPRVPEVVKESQHEAHVDPEASASAEAVNEKRDVEEELLEKVPTKPAAAGEDSALQSAGIDTEKAAAAVSGAFAALSGATFAAKDKAVDVASSTKEKAQESAPSTQDTGASSYKSYLPESVQNAINSMNASSTTTQPPTEGIPEPVTYSLKEAHESPEAAANPEAVHEKSAVEQELLSKVPESNETGEHAPKIDSAASPPAPTRLATGVPEYVGESIKESHQSPEAATNREAVAEKDQVEQELLSSVHKRYDAGEHAPKIGAGAADIPSQGSHAAPGVPEAVNYSIEDAHQSPEAAANPEAVQEKSAVEKELLRSVKPTNESGEPAPVITAEISATAPGDKPVPISTSPSGGLSPNALEDGLALKSSSEDVPSTAGKITSIPPHDPFPAPASSGLNASAAAPAQPPTSMLQAEPEVPRSDSRDISPMSRGPTTQPLEQPSVTSGVLSSPTAPRTGPSAPATPAKSTASSAKGTPESVKSGATEDKKKKRHSFFGKLKSKLKDL